MIKGTTVTLILETQTGTDGFNNPIYTSSETNVANVLVTPVSTSDVVDTLNLTGKKAIYTLCIPKNDANDWEDKKVRINGHVYKTIGKPQHYIDENVPLDWNDQIQVEIYE
jgi:hypothetical protein